MIINIMNLSESYNLNWNFNEGQFVFYANTIISLQLSKKKFSIEAPFKYPFKVFKLHNSKTVLVTFRRVGFFLYQYLVQYVNKLFYVLFENSHKVLNL